MLLPGCVAAQDMIVCCLQYLNLILGRSSFFRKMLENEMEPPHETANKGFIALMWDREE
jgi:hypothetical protein